jgi:hypothetical protein
MELIEMAYLFDFAQMHRREPEWFARDLLLDVTQIRRREPEWFARDLL